MRPRIESLAVDVVSPGLVDVTVGTRDGVPLVCTLERTMWFADGDPFTMRWEQGGDLQRVRFKSVRLGLIVEVDERGEVVFADGENWLRVSCTFDDGATDVARTVVSREIPFVEARLTSDLYSLNGGESLAVDLSVELVGELPESCGLERVALVDGISVDRFESAVVPSRHVVVMPVPLVGGYSGTVGVMNEIQLACTYGVGGVAWLQVVRVGVALSATE